MLYEVLKTAKMGAGQAPDLYTALLAKNLRRDGEVKTLSGIPPLTFRSNGTPLLDLLISGNEEHSGTPSPDSPIMPQGTGERTGNLFDESTATLGKYINAQGIETTSSAQSVTERLNHSDFFAVVPNEIYTLSSVKSSSVQQTVAFCWYDATKTFLSRTTEQKAVGTTTYSITGIAPSNARFAIVNYTTANSEVMLNTGSTALPFEPFGVKIPISSANTTTPVYLGEVQTTRRIKKLVLTGNETVAGSAVTGGWIITNLSDSINNTTGLQTSYCSHYAAKNNGAMSSLSQGEMCISTQVNNRINFVTTFATAEDFKSYLATQYAAGTPVTVWYVLATPTTGIVNEPLMKIGDYADTLSMEQAGVEIPTVRGTNTLDVLTDVKPSEIYIKYKS